MAFHHDPTARAGFARSILIILLTAGVALAAAAAMLSRSQRIAAKTSDAPTNAARVADASPSTEASDSLLQLPNEAWSAAGLEIGAVTTADFHDSVTVTGKVTFNEDRVAHVFPHVAGRVVGVHVSLGQAVTAGQRLVTIESPEIGNAKLALFRDRLLCDFARMKDEWVQEISRNTHELVEALRARPSIEEIDASFREKRLGRNRDQLIAAYSSLRKSTSDYERLEPLSRQGITPGKQSVEAKAAMEADRAAFQALLETLDSDEHYNALLSTHARQEAENRVAVDEASLKLYGFADNDLKSIDPVGQGRELSEYPMTAPFNGTIISKDVALMERVGLDHQIMTVADLSTVWIKADIFEQHLPLLESLEQGTVEVTSPAWPGEVVEARVFHTGEVVDEASRTVGLRAVAENPQGHFKPGMFVQVALPGRSSPAKAIVPESAVLEHQGQSFVFLHRGEDRFERRAVALGRREGAKREVLQGLAAGDAVVVKGGFALKSKMLAGSIAGE